jgi:hypothetical protein
MRDDSSMKSLIILASILTFTAFAQETQTLLAEAQRDYIRGDRKTAKEKFTLVSKAEPNNRIAANYLRIIAAEEKKQGGDDAAVLRLRLDKTIIDRIDFRDASVGDALDFLGKKIAAVSPAGNKVNIVQQLTEEEKLTRVTLTLHNVPASEALKYIGQIANLTVSYEQFAVVVKPNQQPKQ